MTEGESKREAERRREFHNALIQWAPAYLDPTAAELQRIVNAALKVAQSIREYDDRLGGKGASEVRDFWARLAFLHLLRAVDELLTAGEKSSEGLDNPEVEGWPDFGTVQGGLAELWCLLEALQSCLGRVAPGVVDVIGSPGRSRLYRWWLYDARPLKPKELVVWWYSPDDAEKLAQQFEEEFRGDLEGRSSTWSISWNAAVRVLGQHPSPDAKRLYAVVNRIWNGQNSHPPVVDETDVCELVLRVQARETSGTPPKDLLAADRPYETKDVVLDTEADTWPRLGEWVSDEFEDNRECELADVFEVRADELQTAIDNVTTRVVHDPWDRRRFRIPPEQFPFSVVPLPYPDDFYERDPFKVAQDIETLTRIRLRDGGNPLWLLAVFHEYIGLPPGRWNGGPAQVRQVLDEATARNPSGVSFGEYFVRRYPRQCAPPESRAQEGTSPTVEGRQAEGAEVPATAAQETKKPDTRPDRADTKPDNGKKSRKIRRPMNPPAVACAKQFRTYRKAGDKTPMEQVVRDYVAEHGGSVKGILRILTDNPEQWKADTKPDTEPTS